MADPLATLVEVKRYLDFKPDPTAASVADEELTRLVAYATAALAGAAYLPPRDDGEPVSFAEDVYREHYDGTGTAILLLRRGPVSRVQKVLVDGTTIPRATHPTALGFVADRFAVYLRAYRFTRGVQNIEVLYTAGLPEGDPVLDELRQAAVDLVALVYRNKAQIGIQSKTLGPEVITFMQQALPDRARSLAERLQRKVAA
jgi:hypothetical protein